MQSNAKKLARKGNIVHHVPGRLRIKIMGAPASDSFFSDIKKTILNFPGVNLVRVNPHSSSIVVNYISQDADFHNRIHDDPALKQWLTLLKEDGSSDLIDPKFSIDSIYSAQHSRIAESIVSVAEQLDAGLLQASNGYLDFKVLLPLGIAVATSLHRARGRGTPMWISLSTFAFNSFLTFHHRRINKPMQQNLTHSLQSY